MKILQLIRTLEEVSGGARVLVLLAEELAKAGHSVTVAYYTGYEGVFVKRLKEKKISVINLGWQGESLNRWQRIELLYRLRKFIKKNNFNVIHAHHWDSDYFAVLAGLGKRCRKITTIHGNTYFDYSKKKLFRYNKIILPVTDWFVCVSEQLKNRFLKQFNDKKVSVINNAPTWEFFDPADEMTCIRIKNEFQIKKDEILIGVIANCSKIKGIEILLRAFKRLNNNQVKIIFVGLNYEKYIEDYKKITGKLFQNLIFAGARNNIPELLDTIDLFILPSISEEDPMALSEAMAKAKPIIASEVGDIPKKIKTGETGILVPPANVEKLTQAINFFIKNPEKMKQMGENARRFIQKNFSPENLRVAYETLYYKL